MGYIHDLGESIEKRLVALEEVWKEGTVDECDKQRYEIVKFIKEKILESYKNGLKTGKGEGDSNTPRAPRKPARTYQK